MFNRIEAKMQAKASMRQASPSPIWVTAVFLLLTAVLVFGLSLVVEDPWVTFAEDIQAGYTPEQSWSYLIQQYGAGVFIVPVVQLLLVLYQAVMQFGYTSYTLRLARNEAPGFANLFDGFAKFLRVLWMNLLIGIFMVLRVSVMVLVPVFALIYVATLFLGDVMVLIVLVYGRVMAAVIIMMIVAVGLRYMLSSYFLLDDPSCTARGAIRRSKRVMKGWKMEAFSLLLSFCGWLLLGLLTAGILFVWVLPYLHATVANFYDCVTGGQSPTGDSVGPDYRVPGDGPLPF